jgi:hypothetical protein
MSLRHYTTSGRLLLAVFLAAASTALAQAGAETFSATATVKTAAGTTANAPVTISVDRKMSPSEADAPVAAFKGGGVGTAKATPTRLTVERPTDKGHGSGTLSPAAKVTVTDGAFVVEDHAAELVRLTSVSKK